MFCTVDLATSWVFYDTILSGCDFPGSTIWSQIEDQVFTSPETWGTDDGSLLVRANKTMAFKTADNVVLGTVVGSGHDVELRGT